MLLIDQDFLPQATSLIKMATSHICISTFKAEISIKPRGHRVHLFFDTLFAKRKEGIKVDFLLNWNSEHRAVPQCNMATLLELKKQKINIRILPNNRCCHAKIIMVDKSKAIVGSHNLSIASCTKNFEVSYLITNDVSIYRLASVFAHNLANSKTP